MATIEPKASQQPPQPQEANVDPLDDLLTLEDALYTSAYQLGVSDGARAGRIEGRIFGLEKGFEKFAGLGMLHARACVWGARLPSSQVRPQSTAGTGKGVERDLEKKKEDGLQPLPGNPRLEKHVQMLHGLTDPLTFATENTDEAVADFDDRFKRAGAKAKVIERIIGETDSSSSPSHGEEAKGQGRRVNVAGQGKKEDSIEDFSGSRFLG